jgi:hypothetical protein
MRSPKQLHIAFISNVWNCAYRLGSVLQGISKKLTRSSVRLRDVPTLRTLAMRARKRFLKANPWQCGEMTRLDVKMYVKKLIENNCSLKILQPWRKLRPLLHC